jgi:hypothetical protein
MKDYLFGRDAMRNWAKEEFSFGKIEMKKILHQALSKVHISFDIWTSPYSTYAFLGVVAHFITKTRGPTTTESILLAMRRMYASHSGEDIAKVLRDVLVDFELVDKVGVFMADNAETNDVAVKVLLAEIRPDLKEIAAYRGRCLAHILNLAARDFLYGNDPDLFLKKVAGEEAIMTADQLRVAQSEWRTKGALGKLHNLIIYIRSSPQRKEVFRQVVVDDDEVDCK